MVRSWLLGSVAFSVGFSLSFLSSRDLKKAFFTGLITLPATYAGVVIVDYRQKHVLEQQAKKEQLSQEQSATSGKIDQLKDQIAVFWDYENAKVSAKGINVPLAEALIAYSESLGHPRLKTVYSNWRRESEVLVQALYSLGFEPIHVAMGKPNSVDVKLTVDCLNTAYRYPSIKRFIIVTADKDFIPLVNALKAMERKVTIIGRTEVVSEQLMLSADNFISLEQLSENNSESANAKLDNSPGQTISYKDAIECLIIAINEARNQGKSTRFGVIDTLMRDNNRFRYQGVSSIRKSDGTTFSKFSGFIDIVEQDGKVKVQTIEGFKELFLIEEDPIAESEFSSQDSDKIERKHWVIIIDHVKRAFQEGDASHPLYGRFMMLFNFVRQARRSGDLTHSNRTLQNALSRLVEIGVLVKQADESYRLVENLSEKEEEFLNELTPE